MSVHFYDSSAEDFGRSTAKIDMRHIYAPFLTLLPEKAHILDAGCGSGRDAQFFLNLGFQVSAMDASEKMAEFAENWTGLKVQVCRFEDSGMKGLKRPERTVFGRGSLPFSGGIHGYRGALFKGIPK